MIAVDLGGAAGLFTTREGGVSEGPYASLNLGPWTDDDPAAVAENRRRVADHADAVLAQGHQVHGTHVERVCTVRCLAPNRSPDADGQATALPGVAPIVLVADCVPVLLGAGGAVAAIHAGWRGLAEGVLAEGLRALREVGGDGPVHAAIGPCARACCYEVGDDVAARFPASARRGAHLDLPAIARAQLDGVALQDVERCTICEPEAFFSHRRDGGVTGRQAGLVWLA